MPNIFDKEVEVIYFLVLYHIQQFHTFFLHLIPKVCEVRNQISWSAKTLQGKGPKKDHHDTGLQKP